MKGKKDEAKGKELLYGGFFAFLPRVRGFLLETVYPERAVCRACGRISQGGVLCGSCESRLRADGTVMAWEREELENGLDAYIIRPYTGVARQLVIRLKHSAEKCLAEELGNLLLPLPAHPSFPKETVVTWVPMPESRKRERCIDHGRLLAEAAAERLGLECRQLLRREETGDRPQATLNRAQREANLARAFRPAGKIDFPVLLTDDVLTTGTTARRCAAALREGGAESVTVLAFTRALGGFGVKSGIVFPPGV